MKTGTTTATMTTTGEPLPRIPPLRGTLSLDVPLGRLTISPELLFAGRQDRVFRDETETGGYSVVNMDASYVWPRQHLAHVVSFTAYNLTNALYRNHTSFIKDLALEMGRGAFSTPQRPRGSAGGCDPTCVTSRRADSPGSA